MTTTATTLVHADETLTTAKVLKLLLSLLLHLGDYVNKHYSNCKSLNFTSCCSLMRSTLALSYASDMPRAALLLLVLILELVVFPVVPPSACIPPAQPFLRPKFAASTRLFQGCNS
jgi:hypothetical protein